MLSFPEMENLFLMFSVSGQKATLTFCWTNSIRKNQGSVSSSLAASSVSKSASLMSAAPACTSEWCRGAVAKPQAGGAASRAPKVCKEAQFEAHPVGRVFP